MRTVRVAREGVGTVIARQWVWATLARDATLRVPSRELILKGPFEQEFDVSPDGSRFLVLVQNWMAELRRVTAAGR